MNIQIRASQSTDLFQLNKLHKTLVFVERSFRYKKIQYNETNS